MSFRSTLAFKSLLRHGNITTVRYQRHMTRTIMNYRQSTIRNLNQPRFFSSASKDKQNISEISNMVSSPELLQAAKSEPKGSKLKELSKKYGAVGILVYLGVGFVDLGITLGIIQFAGLEKVKALEEATLDIARNAGERIGVYKRKVIDHPETTENDKDEAPSFASVFILAYGIHKTILLPVRLGITAAITPAVVRKIHQLGWARYFPRILGGSPKI